jgi:ADP-ribosyl-[dinitrogen reductase] hydrolase
MTIGTLVGCAVGDALGVPFEMKAPSHKSLKEWDGLFRDGGTFRKFNKAGEWSDDTIASICLTESLLECNGFDVENAAQKYLEWYKSGEFRGMGSTTSHALWRLKSGQSWKESGMVGDEFGGNGTAMRAAPLGVFYLNNLGTIQKSPRWAP